MKFEEIEKIGQEIHVGSSYTTTITRKSGLPWDDEDSSEYEIFDYLGASVGKGQIDRSDNKLSFDLTFTNTTSWKRGKTYMMTIRVKNSITFYNVVKREVHFRVR